MNAALISLLFFSVVLAGNCGVYSNNCERITGFSWSTVTNMKVSCGLNGYVSKIVIDVDNYNNDKCDDDSFMKNTYTYGLKKLDNASDKNNAKYTVTLKKSTMKALDVDVMQSKHIRCTPAVEKGKTYKWNEITCKVLVVEPWARYSKIGESFESSVKFEDKKMVFGTYYGISYALQSKFLGCWQWWSITLLILLIIAVVGAAIFFVMQKKGGKKEVPKKSSK